MAVNSSEYKIEIKSTADLAAVDRTIAKLQGQIEATKALGKDTGDLEKELQKAQSTGIEAELARITGRTQESGQAAEHASHGVEKLGLTHRQFHTVLEQVAPGIAGLARFMQSGFAGAVGVVLIAFQYLNAKVEEFSQMLDALSTGSGARGEWAQKIKENVSAAAAETALFNQQLDETLSRQETLAESTNRAIAADKAHSADLKSVADAQRGLDLARLALNMNRKHAQVIKQRDDLLRDCKVLLAALGQPDAPATPSAAPADFTTTTDESGK